MKPVSEDRCVVHWTLGRQTIEKLERARKVLSHKVPHGNVEAILNEALELLLAKHEWRMHEPKRRVEPKPGQSDDPREVPRARVAARWRKV